MGFKLGLQFGVRLQTGTTVWGRASNWDYSLGWASNWDYSYCCTSCFGIDPVGLQTGTTVWGGLQTGTTVWGRASNWDYSLGWGFKLGLQFGVGLQTGTTV